MATHFPPEWVEELRARADIVSIVSEYVPLKQNGRRYWGLCPFHNEKTASFSVSPDDGFYYCFGCKAGGTVIQFVMHMERLEYYEAIRYLADKLRVPLPSQVDDEEHRRTRSLRERIVEINRKAAHFYHRTLYTPEGASILAYLHKRGLDDPVIRMFGLGAAPSGWDTLIKVFLEDGVKPEELVQAGLAVDKNGKQFDMFRNRAIFPIISAHGAVLGFGGRAMEDVQPKYLNTADTPAFNKRMNVYAHNLLRKTRGLSRVLLVEGYMDVASLVKHGVTGVVATLGTALTTEQAKLLKRYAPEVWVAYDGDTAGQKAILRALDVLEGLEIVARVLALPDGLDPDEFVKAEGREAFDALQPMTAPAYRMQRAADGLDLSAEEGRTQYAIACAPILKRVKQPVERENLLRRLSIETGYSKEVLVEQIGPAISEKPMYIRHDYREKLPEASKRQVSDEEEAEKTLLSLMAAGLVEEGLVEADRFSGEYHRRIAAWLLSGKRPAELLEQSDDDPALMAVLLDIINRERHVHGDDVMNVITECLERMRRGWINDRIRTLKDGLKAAAGNDKVVILKEIEALVKEQMRLRPGRKE